MLVHHEIIVPGISSNIASFLRLLYQPSQVSINHLISKVEWNAHWNSCKERTSSSKSGLHYGHYLAHYQSDLLSECKCMLVQLAVLN